MSLNKDFSYADDGKHDEQSIEELFVTYKPSIYQFVYRYCQDEQLSIDIVQDTFIRFHKYHETFDESKSSVKTFLFRMAYQIMINRLKRRNRFKKLLPFLYQQNDQHELPLEDKLTIQSAIQQLPDDQRAVILLTYYHDQTQKEISKILEIPIGTVKSRLHTSLKKLKVLLEVKE
ncbi:RNA polymerase sigma factor [Metabacillus endolithicus]|uniref:RNA polymerase sigma factor n=1 Tax=Metabacillus endolithicus TaxID=1535204 RepID=A0ABW5BR50_9BACI|nr:RNA polymerase sigma factor [Metabacillus endolithicus]UPG63588.1 RNA polymerase sigma factor [Metabacillus endolithicus]